VGVVASGRAQEPQTVKVDGDGVRAFLLWCAREGHRPELGRPLMVGFVADLLDAGAKPATARSRQLACLRFSAPAARHPMLGARQTWAQAVRSLGHTGWGT
jgi:hypothetical protein